MQVTLTVTDPGAQTATAPRDLAVAGTRSRPTPTPDATPEATRRDSVAGATNTADATRPEITGVRLSRRAVRLSVSEAVSLRVTIRGRGRVLRRSVAVEAGRRRIAIRPRLKRGRYRISIVAIDAAGNTGRVARRAVSA